MNKSDLRNGCVVEIRQGDKYILIDEALVNLKGGYMPLYRYTETLEYTNDDDFTIMKVCQDKLSRVPYMHYVNGELEQNWTWVREEEKPEEPKYKVGDFVETLYGYIGKIVAAELINGTFKYRLYFGRSGYALYNENQLEKVA